MEKEREKTVHVTIDFIERKREKKMASVNNCLNFVGP